MALKIVYFVIKKKKNMDYFTKEWITLQKNIYILIMRIELIA